MKNFTTLKTGEVIETHAELIDGRYYATGKRTLYPGFIFILDLTYNCTRRCSYCYAFNQNVDLLTMSETVFQKSLKWIEYIYGINKIGINGLAFLGGEPLLETPRIKRAMDFVVNLDPKFVGMLFTNGDLIDSVNWSDLQDINLFFMNVCDTDIDELLKRMLIVKNNTHKVQNQTLVITMDDFNLARTEELVYAGLDNFYRLRIYREMYKLKEDGYLDKLLKSYNKVCDIFETYVGKGYDVQTDSLFDMLVPYWNKGFDGNRVSPYVCGRGFATIHPDGSVGACIRNQTKSCGTIDQLDRSSYLDDFFENRLSRKKIPQECFECPVRNECSGGCPNDKLIHTGTNIGKSMLCSVHKEIIPRLQKIESLKRDYIKSGKQFVVSQNNVK